MLNISYQIKKLLHKVGYPTNFNEAAGFPG